MKKFGFYFKKGYVLAKMAMKGKNIFTKLLLGLYLILSFFGKIVFFLRPIFLIADNNLAMMITEGHDFEIDKLFEGINSKKRYSSLLLSCLFIDGISLAAAIIMVLPFAVWNATGLYNPYVPPMIFVVVFAVASAVLMFVFQLMYSPMGFVACKGKDLSSGDVLYLAKEGSAGIKGKTFALCLINYLVIIVVIGLLVYLPFFMGLNFIDEEGYVAIFVNFVALILFLAFMLVDVFILQGVRLSLKISLYSLFNDNIEAKHVVIAKKAGAKNEFVPLFEDDKEVKE